MPAAVPADLALTERQKQVLLEIYDSFRRENTERAESTTTAVESDDTAATTDAAS